MAISHTISVLVTNEVGVLSRIVDLFSGRGYNIESLTVAPTLDNIYSRITIVTRADNDVIEQICKQLNRLIPVIKVANLTVGAYDVNAGDHLADGVLHLNPGIHLDEEGV